MGSLRAFGARRPRSLAGLLLAGGAVFLTGCGPEGLALDSPAGGGNARADSNEQQRPGRIRENVLNQYRQFLRVTSHLTDVPSHERPARIETVATDPILPTIMTNLARMDTAGEVLYGQPIARDPEVELRDDTIAVVRDCQDTSDSGRKKESTGRILSKGVSRAAVVVTFELGDDGVWRASKVVYPSGTKC